MASIVRPGPCQMVLLRHAEKTGRPQDSGLSPQGQRRAGALAEVFAAQFGLPDVIIACRSTVKSTRPVDTVRPLASQLGLAIADGWGTQDYGALAEAVTGAASYANKSILICWRHDTLQALAQALGAADPPPWPETLYDCVWILRPTGTGVDFEIGRQGISPHLIEPSSNL
jgi:hypothetical protein